MLRQNPASMQKITAMQQKGRNPYGQQRQAPSYTMMSQQPVSQAERMNSAATGNMTAGVDDSQARMRILQQAGMASDPQTKMWNERQAALQQSNPQMNATAQRMMAMGYAQTPGGGWGMTGQSSQRQQPQGYGARPIGGNMGGGGGRIMPNHMGGFGQIMPNQSQGQSGIPPQSAGGALTMGGASGQMGYGTGRPVAPPPTTRYRGGTMPGIGTSPYIM